MDRSKFQKAYHPLLTLQPYLFLPINLSTKCTAKLSPQSVEETLLAPKLMTVVHLHISGKT